MRTVKKKATKTTCPIVRFSDCHNLRKLLNYVVQLPVITERKKLLNIVSHFDTNRPNQTKAKSYNSISSLEKEKKGKMKRPGLTFLHQTLITASGCLLRTPPQLRGMQRIF